MLVNLFEGPYLADHLVTSEPLVGRSSPAPRPLELGWCGQALDIPLFLDAVGV